MKFWAKSTHWACSYCLLSSNKPDINCPVWREQWINRIGWLEVSSDKHKTPASQTRTDENNLRLPLEHIYQLIREQRFLGEANTAKTDSRLCFDNELLASLGKGEVMCAWREGEGQKNGVWERGRSTQITGDRVGEKICVTTCNWSESHWVGLSDSSFVGNEGTWCVWSQRCPRLL